MTFSKFVSHNAAWRSATRFFKRGINDQRGIAAVEFALIAPLLLCMYFLSMEVSLGLETNRKMARAGSTIADLLTQEANLTTSDIDNIAKIGTAVLFPYKTTTPIYEITAIQLGTETTPVARVAWARQINAGTGTAGPAARNDVVSDLPTALRVADAFYIKVKVKLDYRPVVAWNLWSDGEKRAAGLLGVFNNIDMGETYYLRPRQTARIDCSTC